jgi:hypothetical protein
MSVYDIAKEYEEKYRAIPYPTEGTREEKRQPIREYREKCAEINEQFKQAVLAELGISNHPKADELWRIAWEHGHSSGYNEVAIHAEELAELLN